jgi:alpha-beta hydrolase superfamily lysophospholipase
MKSEMTLRSRVDGLDISVLLVTPEEEPKAVIQLSHGMCGCKERYIPMMEYMAGKGVACVAGDHRGHGHSVRSSDDLGYMYHGGYMALVDDMRLITRWIRHTYPGVPVYLVGHSMGSMAARIYAKYDDSEIDGLVLTGSPSWNPMSYVGKILTGFMCMVGLSHHRMSVSQRITSWGYNRKFASEGSQAWTCSDPEVRRSFMDNQLCNYAMTANGSYNVMSMMGETYRDGNWAVTNPSMPVLFISGDDDPIMGKEKNFHRSAQNICDRGYTNVTSAIYPGMRHEVLNEIGKEEVWDDILNFMGLKTSGR